MKTIKHLSLLFFSVFQLLTLKAGSREIRASIEPDLQLTEQSYSATPWSVRMAESEMKRRPNHYSNGWGYVDGTFLKGVEELWRTTNDNKYFQYIKNSLDAGFQSNGQLKGYDISDHSLDDICEGRILLLMHKEDYNETKYQKAIDTLRTQLRIQPKTYDGGFWHRNNSSGRYPHQMWLDGVYMANPFLPNMVYCLTNPQILMMCLHK